MNVVTTVSQIVQASPAAAFATFTDYGAWRRFMPREFRPLEGPGRALRPGDRVGVLIDAGGLRLPTLVEIYSVDAPREMVWGGGNALWRARHRFAFLDAGDGTTRIESEEEWAGLLLRSRRVS